MKSGSCDQLRCANQECRNVGAARCDGVFLVCFQVVAVTRVSSQPTTRRGHFSHLCAGISRARVRTSNKPIGYLRRRIVDGSTNAGHEKARLLSLIRAESDISKGIARVTRRTRRVAPSLTSSPIPRTKKSRSHGSNKALRMIST